MPCSLGLCVTQQLEPNLYWMLILHIKKLCCYWYIILYKIRLAEIHTARILYSSLAGTKLICYVPVKYNGQLNKTDNSQISFNLC